MSYTRAETLLRVDGVRKSYGSKEVLSGITVDVRNLHCSDLGRCVGQVVAFLGPSGCGKSTLFRIISGLERPTSGAVYLDGSDTPVQAGHVGVVLQNYPMSRNRTVLGNISLAGRIAGMSLTQSEDRAHFYLEQFGLSETAAKYPIQLSGGMRQRVAIARQLVNMDADASSLKSQLLLMDEPFSALDLASTRSVCHLIRNVADSIDRRTIIIVTHDLRAALSVADYLWIMGRSRDDSGKICSGGKIVRELDVAEFGLPWSEDVHADPRFIELEQEIDRMFSSL